MPIFDILLKALPCSFSQLLHHRLITETVSLHKWQRSLIRHDYLAYKMYTLKKNPHMPYIPSTLLQTSQNVIVYHNHIEIEISSKLYICITSLGRSLCLTINVPYKPQRIKQHTLVMRKYFQ